MSAHLPRRPRPPIARRREHVDGRDVTAELRLHEAVLRTQLRALAVEHDQKILHAGLVAYRSQAIGFARLPDRFRQNVGAGVGR